MTVTWLTIGFGAAQIGFLIWSLITTWRIHQRLRHIMILDKLLMRLCLQAFRNAHLPIWQAWTYAMGEIEIEIKQIRRKCE